MTKLRLALLFFVAAILALFGAWFLADAFWQNVVIQLFGVFLALSAGLVVVNIFLESRDRQAAVRSLLLLGHDSIEEFHDMWMTLVWAKFGRDEFGRITEEYVKASGSPEALKKEVRLTIYTLIKENAALLQKIEALDDTMAELSRMGGWSLDPSLLSSCLDTRRTISQLRRTPMDDTEASHDRVTELIFDVDIHTALTRSRLMELAGIQEE